MAKKENRLALSFMAYQDIKGLSSEKRIRKILDTVIENRIVIIQGKLEPLEETSLIQSTMALIGRIKGFRGIEIATIQPEKELEGFEKVKQKIVDAIVGPRDFLTVIGPAAVIKDIKKNPTKIDLFLKR